MLKISNEQMDEFLPKSNKDIINFIIGHLNNEHYDYISDIPSDTLREMVANGITRARSYSFSDLEDVTVFVTWMFVMAPNFDEQPKLREILHDVTIPAEERINKLLVDELNSSWEEVQQNYDGDAWFPELQNEGKSQTAWQQN
jgi:hypothetical protein